MHRQHFYNELQSLEKEKGQLNCLDLEIIKQEVRQTVNKFKNKKLPFVGRSFNVLTNLCIALYCIVFILQHCTKQVKQGEI